VGAAASVLGTRLRDRGGPGRDRLGLRHAGLERSHSRDHAGKPGLAGRGTATGLGATRTFAAARAARWHQGGSVGPDPRAVALAARAAAVAMKKARLEAFSDGVLAIII